jgi:alkylated DNA repair dioxygenase AlkB
MASEAKPFLEKLASASTKTSFGLFYFQNFLTSDQAQEALEILNAQLPWDLRPTLYGQKLNQHAFEYNRFAAKKSPKETPTSAGVAYVETLCQTLERDFDGTIDTVFCNRFQDPSHQIPWHKDTYGLHIMVLSLGSTREVQFRDTKTKEIASIAPQSGDLYFFPLHINDTHQHSVAPATDGDSGTRLSLVFFFSPPKYATAYRISLRKKLRGLFTYLTGIGS